MKALLLAAALAAFSCCAFAAVNPPPCISLADAANNLASHGEQVIAEVTIRYSGRTLLVTVINGRAYGVLIADRCVVVDNAGDPDVIDLGSYLPNRLQ